MSTVKLGLGSQTVLEKIAFANRVGGALIGNEATFPEPPVAGADLMDLATALQTAREARESARAAMRENAALERAAESALDLALTMDAKYVQNVSNGNQAVIALAGLSVASRPEPAGRLAAPIGLTARDGGAGKVALRWRTLRGAQTYVVERTASLAEPVSWELAGSSTRAKLLAKGLTSGSKYWFRIAASGTAGQSPWSEPVGKVVG
jgi:hypothetical protein